MTQDDLPAVRIPHKEMVRLGIWIAVRVTVSIVLLLAAYYLVPTPDAGTHSDLPWLLVALTIFGIIVAVQVPAIANSKYPNLRAVEALSVTLPLFLLIFARIYLSNSLGNPASFSESLDHTKSLYFTITVFATVGFGDITPETNPMRLLVSAQMLLNLVFIGLVIRLLTGAARRGVAKRRAPAQVDAKAADGGGTGEKTNGTPDGGDAAARHQHDGEQDPLDNTPLDNTPLDNTPLDNTPLDNTPLDNTPLDNTPLGKNPSQHNQPDDEDGSAGDSPGRSRSD